MAIRSTNSNDRSDSTRQSFKSDRTCTYVSKNGNSRVRLVRSHDIIERRSIGENRKGRGFQFRSRSHIARVRASRRASQLRDAPPCPVHLIPKNGNPVALSRKVDRLTLRKIWNAFDCGKGLARREERGREVRGRERRRRRQEEKREERRAKGGGTVAVGWRRRDENGAFPKAKYPKSGEQLDESCALLLRDD